MNMDRLSKTLSTPALYKPTFYLLTYLSVVLLKATLCVVLLSVICVFRLLVVLVRLSVLMQVIDWKDSSPK